MRTVECLRGRLQAERVASKAAKEEADQLAIRVWYLLLHTSRTHAPTPSMAIGSLHLNWNSCSVDLILWLVTVGRA
jgi:hypothetical protein